MKKILFILFLKIFIVSSCFAYYFSDFNLSSDTVGWAVTNGTATIGWGPGGFSGDDCMYVTVYKTSTAILDIHIDTLNPPFILGLDTIWSFYAEITNSNQPYPIFTQGFSQQGSGWIWATPGYTQATTGSGPAPTGYANNISTTWQRFTLYRNDTTLGTPMDNIGIQLYITDTGTGTAVLKIDNTLFGPSLSSNPLFISTLSLPNGSLNYPYEQYIQATGGTPPYGWTTTTGTLPPSLSLYNSSSTGLISGIPTSEGTYNFTVQVTDSLSSSATQAFTITISHITVNYSISPQTGQTPISPYVYGFNYWGTYNDPIMTALTYPFYRLGGNRLTGYNWVNNASNAGSDYNQESDDWLDSIFNITGAASNSPGSLMTTFYALASTNGSPCLLTLPLAGYVAADKNGDVTLAQTAPSSRWDQVVFAKGTIFSLIPTLSSGSVFNDEFVNFIVNKYGLAANGGVKFYELDNEPSLWPSTHPRIHPTATMCTELVQKGIDCSLAIKAIDSTAEVFGPVEYGFGGYLNLNNAPDWSTVGSGYNWFLAYYLDKMKQAELANGKRLLDVLDLHYYTAVVGDHPIIWSTTPQTDDLNDKLARLQAPRTLWDATYRENSWIAQNYPEYLPIIPTIQTSINQYYPGTKLAITEYEFGSCWDIAGGIAQADVLGIFGKYGLYAASLWQQQSPNTYTSLAFEIYLNYDGNNSQYGDTNVQALMTDTTDSSIYASVMHNNSSELHIMVLNKNMFQAIRGNFTISSPTTFQSGKAYSVTSTSTSITGPYPSQSPIIHLPIPFPRNRLPI